MIFLAGLLSIVVQVVLLRELSAAFYGVDLIYLLALGAWLLWTAAGALLARRSLQVSGARIAILLIAVGLAVPLEVALIRRLRLLVGGVPGAYLPLPEQILASALCLLPASVLLGLLFQWAAKRYLTTPDSGPRTPDDSRRSLARAYAIESAGGVVGGLATTLTLHWRLPNAALALATGGLALTVAVLTNVRRPKSEVRKSLAVVAALGVMLCLVAGFYERRLDRWMTSWNHPDVVESLDSPYGRVTITERAGQINVYENDVLAFESEGTAPEEFVHLALLQREAPGRILVLHGAGAGLLGEVAQYTTTRADDIELDAGAVELLSRRVPPIGQALQSPNVHLTFDDPRRAMAHDEGVAYDVIIVAAAEPSSAQANRFFTREFFALCAARLRPGGVLALRLASIENLWTLPLIARTGSIYAALRQVFRDVVVLPGSTNVVLASPALLVRDPRILGARLAARAIHARMVTPRYVAYLYSNDRFTEIETLLSRQGARPNTDANVASYQATAIFWLSKFVPSLARIDFAGVADAYGWSAARSWFFLAVGAAVAVLWRWRGWPRRALRVGVAAFGGMAVETLLLLHYQLKHGVMFQDLGILLMSVMAGLAAGAWVVDRQERADTRRKAILLRLFFAALLVVSLAVSLSVRTGYGAGFVAIALMLFATGAIVAGVFACASVGDEEQRRLVSPLYAADVLGGCLGSVAASLVLVPLFGLPLTAEWAAALAALALLMA